MLHTLLYFLALFSLSTSSNLAKLNHMPAEVLGFYRLSIAALIVGVWIGLKNKNIKFKLDGKIKWAIISGIFFFLHLFTYKYAAKNTSIANTMIIFSTNPVWTSIGALMLFGEKIERRLYISYLLAVLGVYFLISHDLKIEQNFNKGDISALISALFYGVYMLTGKLARQTLENTKYAFIQYLISALLFAITVLFTDAPLAGYDQISWISVIGLILLPTFLGHFSFTYLVKYMNIGLMTCGKLIEPLFAVIIAFFLFHEKTGPMVWLAFFLTSLSIVVLFSPSLVKAFKTARPKSS